MKSNVSVVGSGLAPVYAITTGAENACRQLSRSESYVSVTGTFGSSRSPVRATLSASSKAMASASPASAMSVALTERRYASEARMLMRVEYTNETAMTVNSARMPSTTIRTAPFFES